LRIELYGIAPVSADANGPLADELIRVWIDVPKPARAVIEVRRTGRPVARRALAIGELPSDAAARFVAIATAEMVRIQALANSRPKPPPPPVAPPREGGGANGQFALAGSYAVSWLSQSEPALLFGPELSLEHRVGATGQALYGRWLVSGDEPTLRWFEVGASIELRLGLGDDWRVRLAARGGAAALDLTTAVFVDGATTQSSEWSARVAAAIGLERKLTESTWLGVAVEPGAALRTLDIEGGGAAAGERSDLGGFVLGGMIGLAVEPDRAPE
jgi:hypothetical protein